MNERKSHDDSNGKGNVNLIVFGISLKFLIFIVREARKRLITDCLPQMMQPSASLTSWAHIIQSPTAAESQVILKAESSHSKSQHIKLQKHCATQANHSKMNLK